MILVDTSVWIDSLRGRDAAALAVLDRVLATGAPFGIAGVIYQEILQGPDSPTSVQRLADYFGSRRFYEPNDPVATHAAAAALYMRCRHAGVTSRSIVECLIARIALAHELALLHSDRGFPRLRSVVAELSLLPDEEAGSGA